MTNKEIVNRPEETVIDLGQIFKALLHRLWLLILAAIVFAVGGFIITWLFVTPTYSTMFTCYVNNHNSSDALTSLSSSDLSARSTLANTTAKIASSETVLGKVEAVTGVEKGNITVSTSVDSSSGILSVRVVMTDRTQVYPCAVTLASVLTEETTRIIEGSSLQIIDSPQEPNGRYSPSYSRNVVIAALLGLILAIIIIVIMELMDDTMRDVSELESQYGVPIVGAIPDLSSAGKKGGYGKYGYGGYGGYGDYAASSSDSRMKADAKVKAPVDSVSKNPKVTKVYQD